MEMDVRSGTMISPVCCGRDPQLDQAAGVSLRRIQSESELFFSAAAAAAASVTRSPCSPYVAAPSPQQVARRMPLMRHSSLPASALDSLADELRDPIVEEPAMPVAAGIEALGDFEERRACSGVSGWIGGDGRLACSTSSAENRWSGEIAVREFEELQPMSIAGAFGFGIGIGGGAGVGGSRIITGGNHGPNGGVEAYYQRLLAEDPGNALLLRNYARYLYEQRDLSRAEEFYERAILASPEDADLRAQYARLLWEFRRDEERAASYFEQAAQASPDDCSVLGSYAAFMWDVDEDPETKSHERIMPSAIPSAA